MKWPGEAIWSIILPKNQRETEIFHFPFFSCFSPLSWLQVLELPWDHCVLTKKSFCIIQIDFFDLIFHLKSLSEHSGKIPVLVKNQGTFTLNSLLCSKQNVISEQVGAKISFSTWKKDQAGKKISFSTWKKVQGGKKLQNS